MSLPTPPLRSDGPTTFADRGDAFMAALPAFEADMNAKSAQVTIDAAAVAAAAPGAIAAANFKGEYAAGTTYQIGQSVSYGGDTWFAKTINLAVTPVVGANWQKVQAIPAQTGQAGKVLSTDGSSVSWANVITSVDYASRAAIRSMTPTAGALIMISGLGLFRWVSASTELDDDETAFATASGVWEIELLHPDLVEAMSLVAQDVQNDRLTAVEIAPNDFLARWPGRVLHGSAVSAIGAVAAVTQVSFTGTVTGAQVEDKVFVSPPSTFLAPVVNVYAVVTAVDTVTVYMNNPSASASTSVNTGTFSLTVFRGA